MDPFLLVEKNVYWRRVSDPVHDKNAFVFFLLDVMDN